MGFCTITGLVFLPSGEPAADRIIIVSPRDMRLAPAPEGVIWPTSIEVQTGPDGSVNFVLESGIYDCRIQSGLGWVHSSIEVPGLPTATFADILDPATPPPYNSPLRLPIGTEGQILRYGPDGIPFAGDPEVAREELAAAVEATSADRAQTALDRAQVATDRQGSDTNAARAETAANNSAINANVYPDIATGRTAVADGVQFQVLVGNEYVRYRRDSATTQTEVGRYPSAGALASVSAEADATRYRLQVIGKDNVSQHSGMSPFTAAIGPVKAGIFRRVRFFSSAGGTLILRVFSRSGNTFTQVGVDRAITVPGAGLQDIRISPAIPVPDDHYLGFYPSTTGVLTIETNSSAPVTYFRSTGNLTTFTDASPATTNAIQIAFDVLLDVVNPASFEALTAQVNAPRIESGFLGTVGEGYTEQKSIGTVVGTFSTTAPNDADLGPAGVSPGGLLTKVEAVYTSGTQSTIIVLDDAGVITAMHNVSLAAAGTAEWVAGVHFPETYVPKGGVILLRRRTGFNVRFTSGGAGLNTLGRARPDAIGEVQTYGQVANTPAIRLTYAILPRVLSDVTQQIAPGDLVDKRFSTAFGWKLGGATVSGDLLVSAASASWTNVCTPEYYSDFGRKSWLSRRSCTIWADINATDQVFGLGWMRDGAATTQTPAVVVDGTDNKLKVYAWDSVTAPTTVAAEATIPWVVNGSSIKLTVRRDRYATIITLTNARSGLVVTLTLDYEAGTGAGGRARGVPAILFPSTTAGGVSVSRFRMVPDRPFPLDRTAKVVIIGDSNTEGNSIGGSGTYPEHSKAFGYLLEDARASLGARDVMILAQGGARTDQMIGAVDEVLPYIGSSTLVIIAAGTNDAIQGRTHDGWRAAMAGLISVIQSRTHNIHLAAIPPHAATLRPLIVADVVADYFGLGMSPVRFDLALSQNNDGATWDPAFNVGDSIHANVPGQAAMFARLMLDVPEVME